MSFKTACKAAFIVHKYGQPLRYFGKRNMSWLHVRNVADDEKIQICLSYSHMGKKERIFNLNRLKNEPLGMALQRLTLSVMTKNKPKKKKGSTDEPPEPEFIPVELYNNGEKLDDVIPNEEAWIGGAYLHVGETTLPVILNPPKILTLKLPSNIMAGFPVFPIYALEFTDISNCQFCWHKCVEITTKKGEGAHAKIRTKEVWEEVCKGHTYTPDNSAIGSRIKVTCVPHGEQECNSIEVESKTEVEAGPGICPFETRHLFTQTESEPGCFRVVTYNVLADLYADSDFSRTVLYPYCSPYALNMDYRKQLLVKEIRGYNADIICLQEVDMKIFNRDYKPSLLLDGLDGFLRLKAGETLEGSATFFRKSKFSFHKSYDVRVSDILKTNQSLEELYQRVCQNDCVKEKMDTRGTILQVTVLNCNDNPQRKLCIANTHLYFHPKADHIRLLQGIICVRHLEQIFKEYADDNIDLGIVFCGDLNSSPGSVVDKLFTTRHIEADYEKWKYNDEDGIEGMDVTHPFHFVSACGYPEYTNYVGGYHGTLDYIYMDSDRLSVQTVIPMPEHSEVILHEALPSLTFPSDHIALVCDIQWKND